MYEKLPDLLRRLNVTIAQNPVWKALAVKTTEVINELVHENRYALSRIREAELIQRGDWMDTPVGRGRVTLSRRRRFNLDPAKETYDFEDSVEVQVPNQGFVTLPVRVLQDRATLINGARVSGFDYFSDYLQDDDYARIHAYVGKFWNQQGGDHFIEFLGYIKRCRFDMESLWEPERGHPGDPSVGSTPLSELDKFVLLEPFSATMKEIWKAPDFSFAPGDDPGYPDYVYPTSHVQLAYDVLDHPDVDFIGVASLFYYLAPIHLVLQRFVATIYAKANSYAGTKGQATTIPQYQSEPWKFLAKINIQHGKEVNGLVIPQYSAALENWIRIDQLKLPFSVEGMWVAGQMVLNYSVADEFFLAVGLTGSAFAFEQNPAYPLVAGVSILKNDVEIGTISIIEGGVTVDFENRVDFVANDSLQIKATSTSLFTYISMTLLGRRPPTD